MIVGPLNSIPSEGRDQPQHPGGPHPLWDSITAVWSHIGNTEIVIGVCVLAVAALWWRTKQWWYAVIPAIAISLQASVFVAATAVTGRQRPLVDHLDPAPPTSSYPSGHMGASTALYVTFAMMAQRIRHTWVRRILTLVFLLVPVLVGYARIYRGMHHVSDVIVGAINGILCALLAWVALRRPQPRTGRRHERRGGPRGRAPSPTTRSSSTGAPGTPRTACSTCSSRGSAYSWL